MEKRHVPVSALFTLLKGKRPFGIMGLIFTLFSLFVLLPLIIVIHSNLKEPFEKYDHAAIAQNGVEKDAVITAINPLLNVTDNGRNPVVISYDYSDNGKTVSDNFETIDLRKVDALKTGDTIKVKAYKGESAIQGLDAYSFPSEMFFMMPVTFFTVGFIFFLIGFIPAYKTYKLYQTGKVKEATVFSMFMDNGLPVSNFGKGIIVNYYYFDSRSNKLFGTSNAKDLTVMHEMRPDDTIKIFVSETDETKSTLVPKKLAVKNGWRV